MNYEFSKSEKKIVIPGNLSEGERKRQVYCQDV